MGLNKKKQDFNKEKIWSDYDAFLNKYKDLIPSPGHKYYPEDERCSKIFDLLMFNSFLLSKILEKKKWHAHTTLIAPNTIVVNYATLNIQIASYLPILKNIKEKLKL